jgi:hypothetical protein
MDYNKTAQLTFFLPQHNMESPVLSRLVTEQEQNLRSRLKDEEIFFNFLQVFVAFRTHFSFFLTRNVRMIVLSILLR